MKRLIAALLATTCLTAPTPARAEPISTAIGLTLLIAELGVTTATAGIIGGALISIAASAAISLAANALLQKPAQAADTPSGGADLSVQYGGALARSAIMGRGAIGGHHVYTNVYGATNEAMECVFVIGDGQHGKITALKYNGKDCTLPAGGLAPGAAYAVPEFVVLGTPCVVLTYYNGTYSQAADASMIANANPPGRWTTDHRGAGVAYLYVHQIYAEGDVGLTGVPQLMIETEGLVLYDPRLDSTNGGSGAHRWGDPSTYAPSSNPAVQEYNFRRGVLVNGQRVLGMTMSPVNLILQMYFAAANINDEPIPLLDGGTEPRYQCSIAVSDDRAASDVLSAMRASTAGYSLERGGQFGPIPGVPQIPIASLAFTDDDMIVGAPARFTKYRSRSELVTATFGQFADPAQFWIPSAFPPRELASDDAALGERIAKSMDLTQVFSSSQAQRIAETERRRTLQQGQGVATLPAKWIGVQPGDWLTYNSARHGNMNVLITGTSLDTARQQIAITYERIANSVYSWTTAGELFPPDVGEPGRPGTLIMIAAGMTAIGVNVPGDGGLMNPGIEFSWTAIFDPTVDQIDFEIRKLGDANVLPFTADFPGAGSAVCSGHGIQASTTYEYRHKLYTVPERDTPWSAWATVISGNQHIVPSALSSMPLDQVTLEMFEAGLHDYVAKQLSNTSALLDKWEQNISSYTSDQEAQNWLDLQISKQADKRIVGQVSSLSGQKTWRGAYDPLALYYADDMVEMPGGKLYTTPADIPLGVVPPSPPWVQQLNAAVISQEWLSFAGPDGAAAQTSDQIKVMFGDADGTLPRSLARIIDDWKAFAGPDYTAAQTSEEIRAEFYGTDPGPNPISVSFLISKWQAFAGLDYAAAQTSDLIEARFTGGPLNDLEQSLAQIVSSWKTFAGPDFAVAQSEQDTIAAIGGNTAAITTNATAIATVDGKLLTTWQLKLDVNGYVSGMKAYNDGALSAFVINTDIFFVAKPGFGGGAPQGVFEINSVGGLPKLVMRGDMFADGTITARAVTTGELITIGAQIRNLVVDNIHIRGAAITVPSYAAGGAVSLSPGIEAELVRVTIPFQGVAGSTVTVECHGIASISASSKAVSVFLRINGTQVDGKDAAASTTTFLNMLGATIFTASGGPQSAVVTISATQQVPAGLGVGSANLFGVAYLR